METKKLSALIKSIGKNAATLREDIQTALIGCAYHAQAHRNVAAFDQLITAVGNGTRLDGITRWIAQNAPVHFVEGKATLSSDRQKEFAGTLDEYMADLAESAKWYDMAPPNNVQKDWDSANFLNSLAAYLGTQLKKADKNDASVAEIIKNLEMSLRVQITKLEDECQVEELDAA